MYLSVFELLGWVCCKLFTFFWFCGLFELICFVCLLLNVVGIRVVFGCLYLHYAEVCCF